MKFAISLAGVLFLLMFGFSLQAQEGWTQTPGCTGATPSPLLFMINSCPDNANEAFNEYFMFQTGTNSYNVNGAGTSLSVSCPAGSINSQVTSFVNNAGAVAILNSLIGPCASGNVFVDAMAPAGLNGNIPPNGIVMAFTTNTPDYSSLPAGYLSSLCGASPIYVIFGTYPGPLPMFKNFGCTGCGCLRYISLSFGGCTFDVNYDVQNLVTPGGIAGDADGSFINLQPAGAIGYGNENGECIPVAEFCTPPPAPILAVNTFAICNGQPAPTFTCTNCDANSSWYSSEFGSTLLGSGTTFTPSPSPTTTTTYWVQNFLDCNSDRIPATVTVNPNPTVSVSIPGGFTYCQGQSISLSASGSSNVGPSPTYNWTISGPNGTVNATGVSPSISIPNAGTYSITLVLTNTATTCFGTQTFNNILTISPVTATFPAGPLTQCETGPGQATFNLTSLDNTVNGGSGQPVTWFLNAGLTVQSLSPGAQLITGGSTTVYAVVNYNILPACPSAPLPVSLIITPPTTTVLTPIGPLCNTAAAAALATTQSGVTGNWSGSGVAGNSFNPAGLSGSVVLTFTPTAGQCALPNTTSVTITTAVAVVINNAPSPLCSTAAPVALNTTQSGVTGVWSGSGVSGNTFNPAGLSGAVVLTFTPSAGQCALPNTASVNVTTAVPVVINNAPPATLCNTSAAVALNTTQSGVTGIWSGTGVLGNTFNPAGLSGNIVLTFTPTVGQCALQNTATVNVTTAVAVVISNAPPVNLCSTSSSIGLNTTQSGITGNWSGSGVSGNLFNPSGLSGTIVLTFTPTVGQCALANTATVNVTTAVAVVINTLPPAVLCSTDAAVGLNTTQSGVSGNWSGNGVAGNTFNPAGLSGAVVLTFTPAAGNCALPNTATVNVTTALAVVINAAPPAALCNIDTPVSLNTTQSGVSGSWTGNGVSGNTFNPAGLSGAIVLTFTPAAGNCALPNTASVNVNVASAVIINNPPQASICNTASAIVLTPIQSGISGNWSGTGVSGNVFNPTGIVTPSVTLTFTPDAGQCALPAAVSIAVNQASAITLTDLPPAAFCNLDTPVSLSTLQSGLTGVWSGNGVSGNQFDPSIIVGASATLTFTPVLGQCALPNTFTIAINQSSAVPITAPPVAALCSTAASVALNPIQSGLAGTWSGAGVSGNQFNPAGLNGTITLTFGPAAGQCALPNTATIVVTLAAPIVLNNLPPSTICSTDAPITLNPTQSGTSGAWSGTGVSGGQFNPSGLNGAIVLTFTPAAGQCALVNTTTVTVSAAAPVVLDNAPPTTVCNTNTFTLLNTTQSGVTGTWTGVGVSGNVLDASALSGSTTLTFTPNAGQCALPNTFNVTTILSPDATTIAPGIAQLCNNSLPGNVTTLALDPLVTGDAGGIWTSNAPAGSIVGGTVFDANGLPANSTYTLTYTVAGAAPCGDAVSSQSITVIICAAGCTENASTTAPPALCGTAGNTFNLNTLLIAGVSTAGGTWTTTAPAGTLAGSIFNTSGLSGSFTVTYTVIGAVGCPNISTNQTITIVAPPNASTVAPIAPLCNAVGSAVLNLSTLVTGNAGGVWSSPDAPGALSGTVFNPSGLAAGSYDLVYTVAAVAPCGVPASSTQVITVAAATTTAGTDDSICGLTYPLNGFSAYAGVWSVATAPSGTATAVFTNPTSAQTTVTVNETGTYTFAWTPMGDPCTVQDVVLIDFTTTPVANAGADATTCGLTYTLGATGIGMWSYGGAGTVSFVDATNPNTAVTVGTAGNYVFTWTAGIGICSSSDDVSITFNTPLTAVQNVVCSADLSNFTVSLNISGGTPPYFVNGNPVLGSTFTGTFTNNSNYSLNVTDSGGCPAVLIAGTQNCTCPPVDTPVLNPFTDTFCVGAPFPTVSVVPNGIDTYHWFFEGVEVATGTSFTPNAAGNYAVQGFAPNSCISVFVPFTITLQALPPVPVLNPSYDFCAGSVLPVLVSATTGNTLQWTGSETGSGTDFQPTLNTSGIYLYTITQTSAAGCVSASVSTTITISNCACPTIASISNDVITCGGSTQTLNATLSTVVNLDRVEWLDQTGAVISTVNSVDVSETIAVCTPQVFTYTFNVYCSDNPAVVSASALVNVTYYPIPDAVITLSPNGCVLTAVPNCSDFLVAPNAVQTTSVNGNTDVVTFTVINNDAALLGLPCSFASFTANFDCAISACPFIVGLGLGSETQVCSGASYTLNLDVTDVSSLASVEWSVDGVFAGGGQTAIFTAPTLTGCNPQTLNVSVNIYCTDNPLVIWDTESFTVTVFPPFDASALTFNNNCLAPPILTSACANYLLTAVSVPLPVPGNNSATWDISYAGSTCISETVTFDYTCTGACPIVTASLGASLSLCDGDIPDFTALQSAITFNDPDGNANGFAWFADAALTIPLTPATYSHSGACLAETFTLYVGLVCNVGTPVPAGNVNLTVYPVPTTVTAVGGCSLQVQDNCGNLLTIEYLQTDGTWAGNVPNATPVFGETADWRAFVAGAPDADGDGNPDCVQTGTVTAICSCTPPPPPVGLVTALTICEGQTNTVAFEASTVADTYIIWISAATGLPLADGTTFVPTVAGTYFAQAVLDANDLCVSTQVVFTLTETPQDNASFFYTNAQYCLNDLPALPLFSGTTGGVFSATGGLSIDVLTGEIDFTLVGNFTITYTTSGVCPDVESLTLSVIDCTTCTPPPAPVGVLTDVTYCAEVVNAVGFEVTTVAGTFVNWYDGSGVLVGTGNTFIATTPGVYTAQAVETGNETCVSTNITATLTELANDDASFVYDATDYCIGEVNPIPTTSQPGGVFTASGGLVIDAITGEIDLGSAASGGSFTITYTTNGACPETETTTINITASAIGLEAGTDLTVCEGEAVMLSGVLTQGIGSTVWSVSAGSGTFGDSGLLTTVFTPLVTGDIVLLLSGQDACGNVAIDSLTVTVVPEVVISVTGQSNILLGQSTELTASGASNYVWQNNATLSCTDCPNPIATPTQTTTYLVSSTDACSEGASFTIVVSPLQDKLLIPNAFSPNGDGVNDVFRAVSSSELSQFGFYVYNRWGEVVFETNNPAEGWDGTFRATLQEIGVYVYYVEYTFANDGTERIVKGNVTLVR